MHAVADFPLSVSMCILQVIRSGFETDRQPEAFRMPRCRQLQLARMKNNVL
jgi:hypothetical protein